MDTSTKTLITWAVAIFTTIWTAPLMWHVYKNISVPTAWWDLPAMLTLVGGVSISAFLIAGSIAWQALGGSARR